MDGKCVYKKILKFNEVINVSYLNEGIYIVKIKEEDKVATRKLIIK